MRRLVALQPIPTRTKCFRSATHFFKVLVAVGCGYRSTNFSPQLEIHPLILPALHSGFFGTSF